MERQEHGLYLYDLGDPPTRRAGPRNFWGRARRPRRWGAVRHAGARVPGVAGVPGCRRTPWGVTHDGGGRGWQGPEARLLLSRLGPPFPQNEDGHTSPPTNSIYRSPRAPKIGTPYIIAIWGSSSGPWTVKVAQQRERQLSRPPQKVRLRRVRDAVRQRTGLARVRRPLGQVRDLVPGQCPLHRIGARRCDRRP